MTYDIFQQYYALLSEEQQAIVYNLTLSLANLNARTANTPEKRASGKFAGKAKAIFSDSWNMSEKELCTL